MYKEGVLLKDWQVDRRYTLVSGLYNLVTGLFNKGLMDLALGQLDVKEGEIVLEIGFGPGYCLERIAQPAARVYGIDISRGMHRQAKRRLERAGLDDKVELCRKDAKNLPYRDNMFDAVFMSFMLELFDATEIPIFLGGVKRVLKDDGRLVVVSLSKEGDSNLVKAFEWLHQKFPRIIDWKPVYVGKEMENAGYETKSQRISHFKIPIEIAVGYKR